MENMNRVQIASLNILIFTFNFKFIFNIYKQSFRSDFHVKSGLVQHNGDKVL